MNETYSDHNPFHSRRPRAVAVSFPYGKLAGWLVLLTIGGLFVYRLSETGGRMCQVACLCAIATSLLASLVGLVPVCKVWGKENLWTLLGVFLSGIIRLLIGLCGAGIIILFTDISRTQFVGFLGLFYIAFMAVDTWLALWVLNHNARKNLNDEDDEQETVVHGNIWDIIGSPRKSA